VGLSNSEGARNRQLANLKRGNNPAAPGNRLPVTHGAYAVLARDALEAKQREVFDALAADAPLRENGDLPRHDGAIVALLAACMLRLESISAYLRDHGIVDAKTGQPRAVLEAEGRIRREAADLLDSLGMTPRSRARLGIDVQRGFDLAAHWAEQAAAERVDGDDEAIDV